MKTELMVRGDKREVREAVARFFEEHKDLYHGVSGPFRLTDYRAVEAKVKVRKAKFVGVRAAASMIAGLFEPAVMDDVSGRPRIEVVAKSTEPGTVLLRIASEDGARPEAVEPLLTWFREELGATTAH